MLELGLRLTNQLIMLYDNRKRVIDLGQRRSIQGLRTKRRWQLVLSASEEITSLYTITTMMILM